MIDLNSPEKLGKKDFKIFSNEKVLDIFWVIINISIL